jgi:glycosyltransferase involved in cell wall biosynthesis
MIMKICYVATDIEVPYTGAGGSGGSAHALEVAKNLVELRNEVHIVCMKGFKGQLTEENLKGIFVHRIYTGIDKVRAAQSISFYRNILNLLIPLARYATAFIFSVKTAIIVYKNKCDLIYERSSSLGAGGIASFLTGTPMVLEVNDPVVSSYSLKRAKRVITTKKELVKGRIEDNRVVEVMWAVNTGLFNPDVPADYVFEKYNLKNKKVIMYMGSFAPWHGVEDIIDAARMVKDGLKNVVFMMVGTGIDMPEYRKKISLLDLDDYFIFTGAVPYDEVPGYICAADITLAPFNPLKSELMQKHGFYFTPLKLFEYMACGKPVISTSVGNVENIIEDKVTGILIPPGSPAILAETIVNLASDDAFCTMLGANARKTVEAKYSWKKHVGILVDIFNKVLAEDKVK